MGYRWMSYRPGESCTRSQRLSDFTFTISRKHEALPGTGAETRRGSAPRLPRLFRGPPVPARACPAFGRGSCGNAASSWRASTIGRPTEVGKDARVGTPITFSYDGCSRLDGRLDDTGGENYRGCLGVG